MFPITTSDKTHPVKRMLWFLLVSGCMKHRTSQSVLLFNIQKHEIRILPKKKKIYFTFQLLLIKKTKMFSSPHQNRDVTNSNDLH